MTTEQLPVFGLDDDLRATTRKPNAAYRVREHPTEAEMAALLAALRRNRHGHRDWLVGLMIYRHGLGVRPATFAGTI